MHQGTLKLIMNECAQIQLFMQLADKISLSDDIFQVTIARVYNWDVHQRRSRQATKDA